MGICKDEVVPCTISRLLTVGGFVSCSDYREQRQIVQHVDCRRLDWGLSDTILTGILEAGTTGTGTVGQTRIVGGDGDREGWARSDVTGRLRDMRFAFELGRLGQNCVFDCLVDGQGMRIATKWG